MIRSKKVAPNRELSQNKHLLPRPLTSSIDCTFEEIAYHQCGDDTNRMESVKFYIADNLKTFPVNHKIRILPSSSKNRRYWHKNQDKVITPFQQRKPHNSICVALKPCPGLTKFCCLHFTSLYTPPPPLMTNNHFESAVCGLCQRLYRVVLNFQFYILDIFFLILNLIQILENNILSFFVINFSRNNIMLYS